jgi:flagellar motor switch protein FliM
MKVGDIIPLHMPEIITAKVDGTPVIECQYGVSTDNMLKVDKLLSSSVQ